jgi:hypothetical protein
MNRIDHGFVTLVLCSVLAAGCKSGPARDATSAPPPVDAVTPPSGPADSPAPDPTPPNPTPTGDASPPTPGSSTLPAEDAASALREIRAALDDVRAADADANVSAGTLLRVDALVGMTRDAIRAALGEPSTCEEDVAFDSQGNGFPVAPCRTHQDWFYSFYHLPEGWVGGGPELLLQFAANDVCASARWLHTQ